MSLTRRVKKHLYGTEQGSKPKTPGRHCTRRGKNERGGDYWYHNTKGWRGRRI